MNGNRRDHYSACGAADPAIAFAACGGTSTPKRIAVPVISD
jgi:hypothetical protein